MARVLAGGVFDLLHPGHIYFLEEAARLGDELIVVIATDERAKAGGKTLSFNAEERRAMVAAIRHVSRAVIGSPEDMISVVDAEEPDIIAIGYDQEFPGLEDALKKKGLKPKIVRIGKLGGYSSSKILKR